MSTYYKLTDKDGYTRKGESNQLQWGEGVEHTAIGNSKGLCSDGYIHVYEDPYVAVFMNQGGYDLSTAKMYECELSGEIIRDGQLKCGGKTCKTIKEIPLPVLTTEQQVEIAIRVSLEVYQAPSYVRWAKNWLSGKDRSEKWAAAAAAWAAAEAAWTQAQAEKELDIISIINQVVNKGEADATRPQSGE